MLLIELMQKKKEELTNMILQAQNRLANSPRGSMRTGRKGKGFRYYFYDPDSKEHGKYLGKSEMDRIKQLSQKEYDIEAIYSMQQSLRIVNEFLEEYDQENLARVYTNLAEGKKKFVHPFVYPTDEFIRRWEGSRSPMKNTYEIRSEIYSNRGEQVRSKSEKIIADYLLHKGIPYKYEEALTLDGRTVYPDFTVLNKRTGQLFYWEHLGMMDDAEYSAKAMEKLTWYERNDIWPGDRLLISWETSTMPLNMRVVEKMIRRYLV